MDRQKTKEKAKTTFLSVTHSCFRKSADEVIELSLDGTAAIKAHFHLTSQLLFLFLSPSSTLTHCRVRSQRTLECLTLHSEAIRLSCFLFLVVTLNPSATTNARSRSSRTCFTRTAMLTCSCYRCFNN